MQNPSKEKTEQKPVTFIHWFFGYSLPGLGLIGLGLFTAAVSPADVIGLGGFLCFFTLGVSLIVEGSKRCFGVQKAMKDGSGDQGQ